MSIVVRALSASVFLGALAGAQAQTFPAKPVYLVVPYAAGGGADALARATAQGLGAALGQQVVVENRPGANQSIGAEHVARAPADGYTLLLFETSLVINPSLYAKLAYDPLRDFAPVSGLVAWGQTLWVHPSVPVSSFSDLIALAKAKPGELAYASPGAGSIPHLAMEMLQSMGGVKLNHIPYKGGGPALVDVTAGRVQMMFATVAVVLSQWKAGKIKAVAVASSRRIPQYPEVPTSAESGLPGFEANAWFGLGAPAGTPADVVARLNAAVQKVYADREFRERNIVPQGLEAITGTPQQFGELMRSEAQKWARVVRDAKIRLD